MILVISHELDVAKEGTRFVCVGIQQSHDLYAKIHFYTQCILFFKVSVFDNHKLLVIKFFDVGT